MNIHEVDRQRWAGMTILEQMGNIYSEVGRSIQLYPNGDKKLFEAALARALDLFNATVEGLVAARSPRTREVLRARDQYLELFFGDAPDPDDAVKIENYFLPYAQAARHNR